MSKFSWLIYDAILLWAHNRPSNYTQNSVWTCFTIVSQGWGGSTVPACRSSKIRRIRKGGHDVLPRGSTSTVTTVKMEELGEMGETEAMAEIPDL